MYGGFGCLIELNFRGKKKYKMLSQHEKIEFPLDKSEMSRSFSSPRSKGHDGVRAGQP